MEEVEGTVHSTAPFNRLMLEIQSFLNYFFPLLTVSYHVNYEDLSVLIAKKMTPPCKQQPARL